MQLLTDPQIAEIERLAGLLATARVRRAMVQQGYPGHGETHENVQQRTQRAADDLHNYLTNLTTEKE